MMDFSGLDIGRYHIVKKLGSGGMATVYQAFDTRLDRLVAIKFIQRETIVPDKLMELTHRFEREARALARLEHHNIVMLYDYGEYRGLPYLVMQYIPGGTLKQRMGTPVSLAEAVRLILPVAKALAYAHEQGVIHRDVKPANILLSARGEPMLSDFGIAKTLQDVETTALTGTGVGIGSPEYMSPEQGMGRPVDCRTDIYSLGCVLFELLTGRTPFTADTPLAIMLKHLSEPLPGPRDLVKALPEQAEQMLYTALAKNPTDRFADMPAFIRALEELCSVSKEPIPIPLPTVSGDVTTQMDMPPYAAEDRPSLSTTISDTAPDEQIPTGPDLLLRSSSSRAEPVIPKAVIPPIWENGWITLKKKTGSRTLLFVLGGVILFCIVAAAAATWSGINGWLQHANAPTLPSPTMTEAAAAFIPPETQTISPTLTLTIAPPAAVGSLATNTVQPTGTPLPQTKLNGKIVFTSKRDGNEEIYVMKADGSALTRLTDNPAADYFPFWSPDGRKVIFMSRRDGNVQIYAMNSDGSDQTRLTGSPYVDYRPSYSPDGRQIVFVSLRVGNYEIYRMNADGSSLARLTNNASDDNFPSWSPDGQKIVFVSKRDGNYGIYVMNPDGSNQTRLASNVTEGYAPVWSPDGRKIAFTSLRDGNNEIYTMNLDGSDQRRLTNKPIDDNSPSWSPDSRRIVFTSFRDFNSEIYIMNADGSDQTRLTHNQFADDTPAFSPDGQQIIFRSDRDHHYEIYTMSLDGSNQAELTYNEFGDYFPSWASEGN